jgi:DNA polymerase-3 subunit beta
MEITLLQNNLKRGLSIVSGVSVKNVNLPILNNLLIEAKDGLINIVATNLEIAITSNMRGKIEKEGSAVIDSKLFANYINLLPNQKVDIKQEGTTLSVKCENYSTKMYCQSSEEYPLIPSIGESNKYEIKLENLKNCLSQTVFSASNNEMRPEMCGVCLIFQNNRIVLVATDSFRLSEQTLDFSAENMGGVDDFSVIVPLRTVSELLRVISNLSGQDDSLEGVENVTIKITENQILFKLGATSLFSRLIMGNFPDYKQIIPTGFKTTAIVGKQELVRAVKTSALFSKDEVNDVTLDFLGEGKGLSISSSNQSGENKVEMAADVTGEKNSLVLNSRYLIEGINSMVGDKVKIEIVDSDMPCLIKSMEKSGLYLIMPLKQ